MLRFRVDSTTDDPEGSTSDDDRWRLVVNFDDEKAQFFLILVESSLTYPQKFQLEKGMIEELTEELQSTQP